MSTFLAKVIDYFEITHPLSELLPMMSLVTFETIAALKNLPFVIRVCTKYKEKTGKELDLAAEAALLYIGAETIAKGKQFFNDIDDETPVIENRCKLVQLLLEQIGNHVYQEDVKKIATLFRIRSGRQMYEIMCANLPLPNITTVDSYIHSTTAINEAELRVSILIVI